MTCVNMVLGVHESQVEEELPDARTGTEDPRQVDKRAVLRVGGEIDLYTAPLLGTKLDQLLGESRDVTLDMTDVSYFDLSGVRTLERAFARFNRAGRSLTVASLSSSVRRVLDVLEANGILFLGRWRQ